MIASTLKESLKFSFLRARYVTVLSFVAENTRPSAVLPEKEARRTLDFRLAVKLVVPYKRLIVQRLLATRKDYIREFCSDIERAGEMIVGVQRRPWRPLRKPL